MSGQEERSLNHPTIQEMSARLHEIDLKKKDWPDEDTVPPNDDVIRSTGVVLAVCNELDYCPTGLGPIADIDGGMEVCFISPSSGDYCNIVFKNTGTGHVSFIFHKGNAFFVTHLSNEELNKKFIRMIIARVREFLDT